ncbi:MAG TPA: hypothetical protein VIM25_02045 [Candidatus Limnocylindrales bacterium]
MTRIAGVKGGGRERQLSRTRTARERWIDGAHRRRADQNDAKLEAIDGGSGLRACDTRGCDHGDVSTRMEHAIVSDAATDLDEVT